MYNKKRNKYLWVLRVGMSRSAFLVNTTSKFIGCSFIFMRK